MKSSESCLLSAPIKIMVLKVEVLHQEDDPAEFDNLAAAKEAAISAGHDPDDDKIFFLTKPYYRKLWQLLH